MGRYCIFGENASIVPPKRFSRSAQKEQYLPVKFGNCVVVGSGTECHAASVGSYVAIGRNCRIGELAVIEDCAVIADNTVVPPMAVVPAHSRVSGTPGLVDTELPESAHLVLEVFAKHTYIGVDADFPFASASATV